MSYTSKVYNVINKEKFLGSRDENFSLVMRNPICRSSWELRLMSCFDRNANIIKWGYETIVIPYINYDGKMHRYFMDFYVEILDKNNKIVKKLIEVKPSKETNINPPNRPKTNNRKALNRYMYEMKTYITNQNKWKATEQFCKKNGFIFEKVTEKELMLF